MTITQYQELAARTINRKLSRKQIQDHALLGLAAETGEVLSIYQKHYQGHDIRTDDVRKEIGDVAWMLAELCTVNGWSLEDVCGQNIDKLKARYPDGFDAERSIHRSEDPTEGMYSGLITED